MRSASVFKRAGHRGPNFVVEHQVRLDGEVVADDVAGCLDVVLTGPGVDASLCIDHCDLPNFAAFVFGE
jgi:hypothetical protein